jgi:hypothetical protein
MGFKKLFYFLFIDLAARLNYHRSYQVSYDADAIPVACRDDGLTIPDPNLPLHSSSSGDIDLLPNDRVSRSKTNARSSQHCFVETVCCVTLCMHDAACLRREKGLYTFLTHLSQRLLSSSVRCLSSTSYPIHRNICDTFRNLRLVQKH